MRDGPPHPLRSSIFTWVAIPVAAAALAILLRVILDPDTEPDGPSSAIASLKTIAPAIPSAPPPPPPPGAVDELEHPMGQQAPDTQPAEPGPPDWALDSDLLEPRPFAPATKLKWLSKAKLRGSELSDLFVLCGVKRPKSSLESDSPYEEVVARLRIGSDQEATITWPAGRTRDHVSLRRVSIASGQLMVVELLGRLGDSLIPLGEARTVYQNGFPLWFRSREVQADCAAADEETTRRMIAEDVRALGATTERLARLQWVRLQDDDLGLEKSGLGQTRRRVAGLAAIAGWAHPEVKATLPSVLSLSESWLATVRKKLTSLADGLNPPGEWCLLDKNRILARIVAVGCSGVRAASFRRNFVDLADTYGEPDPPRDACYVELELQNRRKPPMELVAGRRPELGPLEDARFLHPDGHTVDGHVVRLAARDTGDAGPTLTLGHKESALVTITAPTPDALAALDRTERARILMLRSTRKHGTRYYHLRLD